MKPFRILQDFACHAGMPAAMLLGRAMHGRHFGLLFHGFPVFLPFLVRRTRRPGTCSW
jgi:hypothetical protein